MIAFKNWQGWCSYRWKQQENQQEKKTIMKGENVKENKEENEETRKSWCFFLIWNDKQHDDTVAIYATDIKFSYFI